jgi:hypothetical protein
LAAAALTGKEMPAINSRTAITGYCGLLNMLALLEFRILSAGTGYQKISYDASKIRMRLFLQHGQKLKIKSFVFNLCQSVAVFRGETKNAEETGTSQISLRQQRNNFA